MVKAYVKGLQVAVNLKITRRRIAAYADRIQGKTLDIGAGDQPYRTLFPHIDSYVGTNTRRFYSAEQIETMEPFTEAWIEDAAELPFGDGTFDGALCFQVLSVIARPAAFFEECARVLKPGGRLMLTTDFLYPAWAKEDVMRHTDRHLKDLAEAAGFKVLALESLGGVYTAIHSIRNRALRDGPDRRRPGQTAWWLLDLLLLPFWSLLGCWVYFLEKNTSEAHAFTTGHILICEKT